MVALSESTHQLVDRFEKNLVENLPEIDLPVKHFFVQRHEDLPGMYIRQIFMPKGAVLSSKIHKTQHPFVVLRGTVLVRHSDTEDPVVLNGPYLGLTEPNTRHMLLVLEDTVWVTFHATNEETVDAVEEKIIEHRINPLLELSYKELLARGRELMDSK